VVEGGFGVGLNGLARQKAEKASPEEVDSGAGLEVGGFEHCGEASRGEHRA
jgi:hypothetical protein